VAWNRAPPRRDTRAKTKPGHQTETDPGHAQNTTTIKPRKHETPKVPGVDAAVQSDGDAYAAGRDITVFRVTRHFPTTEDPGIPR